MEERKETVKKGSASSKRVPSKRSGNQLWMTLKEAWRYLWMFRGVIISVPVLVFAIGQAFRNAANLPETVGLNLQATGDFAMTVSRPTAVLVPLLITMACILLTCFTRRPLFPWLISIFTLVVPVLIWFINIYPA